MKTYTYEGREYVESGEVRPPLKGEIYLSPTGQQNPTVAQFNFKNETQTILIPKEQKVSEVQDEYQIPVLVKASARWADFIKPLFGTVILCRPNGDTFLQGPKGKDHGFSRNDKDLVLYPTQAQVEAERAKLAPKPDTLPAPVREALKAADLGCRREGVEKLIEAIYLNPPKVSP